MKYLLEAGVHDFLAGLRAVSLGDGKLLHHLAPVVRVLLLKYGPVQLSHLGLHLVHLLHHRIDGLQTQALLK
jgi:hypothetical protein